MTTSGLSRTRHSQNSVNLFNLSPAQISDLRDTSNILQLLHHRSRNQHRRSFWYRHFDMFRRQLCLVNSDLDSQHFAKLSLQSRNVASGEAYQRISARLDYWVEGLVYKWYTTFKQLILDTQFAVLGIVLVACLGRACQTLDIMARLNVAAKLALTDDQDRNAKSAMHSTFHTAERELARILETVSEEGSTTADFGVAVERAGLDLGTQAQSTDQPGDSRERAHIRTIRQPTSSSEAPSPAVHHAAKRGNRQVQEDDDIDDIFASLS